MPFDMHEHRTRQRRDRHADVQAALMEGHGLGWLSVKWNVTRQAVHYYCRDNWPEAAIQLAENGKMRQHPKPVDMSARLAVIDLCMRNGWSQARIARALGITPSGLNVWLARVAPDGLGAAVADCCDDEEAA